MYCTKPYCWYLWDSTEIGKDFTGVRAFEKKGRQAGKASGGAQPWCEHDDEEIHRTGAGPAKLCRTELCTGHEGSEVCFQNLLTQDLSLIPPPHFYHLSHLHRPPAYLYLLSGKGQPGGKKGAVQFWQLPPVSLRRVTPDTGKGWAHYLPCSCQ